MPAAEFAPVNGCGERYSILIPSTSSFNLRAICSVQEFRPRGISYERQSIMRTSYASYPVELPVQYQTRGEDPIVGHGRTLAIGRETLRFECERSLPLNHKIQLVVAWPAVLPGGAGLNLWIQGTITRSASGDIEVRIGSYEFKTRREAQRTPLPPRKGRLAARTMTAG